MKIEKGAKSVSVEYPRYGEILWLFCENGTQSTGVHMSKEVFEMMRELTTNPEVVAMYERDDQITSY